ncbi:MAG: hypothetical protein ACO3L1_00115 [Flavobacteriaceae bacterium]
MGLSVDGPIDGLVKLAFEDFDEREAYKAYHRHLTYNSKKSMDRAFNALMPLFGLMYRQGGRFYNYENQRVIDYVNYAAFSIFSELRRRNMNIQGTSMGKFIFYFRKKIKHGVISQALNSQTTRIIDFGYECKNYTYGRLITHKDVEAKMTLESLPSILWHKVCENSRFNDSFRKRVCAYILGRLVHGKKPVPKVLKQHFGLSKERAEFFEDYVVVSSRQILDSLWVSVLSPEEDDPFLILSGPLDSYFWEAA